MSVCKNMSGWSVRSVGRAVVARAPLSWRSFTPFQACHSNPLQKHVCIFKHPSPPCYVYRCPATSLLMAA